MNQNMMAKLQQDNIALLVALQPWEQSTFPSAFCVGIVNCEHPLRLLI